MCLYSARGNFECRLPEEGTRDAVRTNEIKEISPAGTARAGEQTGRQAPSEEGLDRHASLELQKSSNKLLQV